MHGALQPIERLEVGVWTCWILVCHDWYSRCLLITIVFRGRKQMKDEVEDAEKERKDDKMMRTLRTLRKRWRMTQRKRKRMKVLMNGD